MGYRRFLSVPANSLIAKALTHSHGGSRRFKSYSAHHFLSWACRGISPESPTHNSTHNPVLTGSSPRPLRRVCAEGDRKPPSCCEVFSTNRSVAPLTLSGTR